MENLKDSIPGITESALELLEAAGFLDVDLLARSTPESLTRELERANSFLHLTTEVPSHEMVATWITRARELVGSEPKIEPTVSESTVKDNVDPLWTAAMLDKAPFALPLPARIIADQQLTVSDIPSAILLEDSTEPPDIRTAHHLPGVRQAKANSTASTSILFRLPEAGQRLEIDTARVRSTMAWAESATNLLVPTVELNERVALIRQTRASTNIGRDPKSRWYIHGVLHNRPRMIAAGAAVTLLLFISTPLAIISSVLLLLNGEMPETFGWVPEWLIVFPMVLPLFGACYLIWGLGGSCRICGQRLFRHGHHRKNSRAHHVRGLGYILPLCFQILIFRWFRWFRCTHCGTPVRLKE